MTTTITNVSYITDLAELWIHTDQWRILELASSDSQDPTASPIPDDVQDRIISALNWGRNELDNFLRNVYPVSLARGLVASVTVSSPGESVKMWNVRLAQYKLSRKRMNLEDDVRTLAALHSGLKQLQKSDAEQILGDAQRSEQILPVGTNTPAPPALEGRESVYDGILGAPWNNLGLPTDEPSS